MSRPQIINFLLFQGGWFAAVLGAAHGHFYFGPVVIFSCMLIHFIRSRRDLRRWRTVLWIVAIGLVVDAMQVYCGLIGYRGPRLLAMPLPLWVVSLWWLFADSLDLSLRWVMQKSWRALLFGAFGGPLSYLAGERFGALSLGAPRILICLGLAAIWGLLLFGLRPLASRLSR